MPRSNSLEKLIMLGKMEGKRIRGQSAAKMNSITAAMDVLVEVLKD